MPLRLDIVEDGQALIEHATAAGLVLRLLGGVAIRVRCPSAAYPPFARTYGDLDVAAPRRSGRAVSQVLEAAGFAPDRRFNAYHGDKRLLFLDEASGRKIDVFLGVFRMCHTLELENRLQLNALTLPLADLLLTKLQIVQLNAKDAVDALALLTDHEVVGGGLVEADTAIDGGYIADLCASDWGWYTTVTDNLEKLTQVGTGLVGHGPMVRPAEQIARLRSLLDAAPKAMKWKMRAALGRRAPWYEEPEEAQ